jgi:hypothetical protein
MIRNKGIFYTHLVAKDAQRLKARMSLEDTQTLATRGANTCKDWKA